MKTTLLAVVVVLALAVFVSLAVLGGAVWLSKRAERDELVDEDQAAELVPGLEPDGEDGDEAVEPATVPAGRLIAAAGYTRVGSHLIDNACLWARRDGREPCERCAPLLVGSAAQLELPRPAPGDVPAEVTTQAPLRCSTCERPMPLGVIHVCDKGEDLRRERVA